MYVCVCACVCVCVLSIVLCMGVGCASPRSDCIPLSFRDPTEGEEEELERREGGGSKRKVL